MPQLNFEAGWLLLQILGALPTTELASCLVGGVGSMLATHCAPLLGRRLSLLYGGASALSLWISTVVGVERLGGIMNGAYVLSTSAAGVTQLLDSGGAHVIGQHSSAGLKLGPQEQCGRLCLALMVLHTDPCCSHEFLK